MVKPKKLNKKAIRRYACGEIAALIQQALDAGAWAEERSLRREDVEAIEDELRKEQARFYVWSHR